LRAGLGFYCHAFPDAVLQDPHCHAEQLEQLYDQLSRVAAYGAAQGATAVALEQMYSPHQFPWTIAGARDLICQVFRKGRSPLYLTIDTGHQTGQRRFVRPSASTVIEHAKLRGASGGTTSVWLGSRAAHDCLDTCVRNGGAVSDEDLSFIMADMDRHPFLFSQSDDADTYSWLESLGCFSPIVHLQQVTGDSSSHLPFTAQTNMTGIIHPDRVLRSLMKAYLHEAKNHGADAAFGVEFVGGERTNGGYKLAVKEPGSEIQYITARFVVNAAGLAAGTVAQAFGIDMNAAGYCLFPNRGHYYRVSSSKSRLVSRLVYPVPLPQEIGLGIHITIDKAGLCKLGPDAEYLNATPMNEWYNFDDSEARREKFYKAVQRYFPHLERQDLSPDQVGVRSKIQAPGAQARDFVISEESPRGLPGVISLVGIESPGLTCAAEIAKEVFRQIGLLS